VLPIWLKYCYNLPTVEAVSVLEKAAYSKQQTEEAEVQACKKCMIIKQLLYLACICSIQFSITVGGMLPPKATTRPPRLST